MKILFSDLPKTGWWQNGVPDYLNNWTMQYHLTPDQTKLKQEHQQCLNTLKNLTDLQLIPFPETLDQPNHQKHDAIFVRDAFISNQKGHVVISNFTEKNRQPETEPIKTYLQQNGYQTHTLSQNAHAEGGEFYYIKNNNLLFAGISRNNHQGIQETARLLNIPEVHIIESEAFHLDTIFTILLNQQQNLHALIACLPLIKNKNQLTQLAKQRNLPLIEIDPIDTIDFDGKGKISVNCLPLPGILLGGSKFQTPGVEEKITQLNIQHIITPTTQFTCSAGGHHCLTNELLTN